MICIDGKKVKKCFLGDEAIGKVYLGDELIFQKISRLPVGYTELKYISNPNLGYIPSIGLSGTKPFNAKKIEITIQITDAPPSSYGYIFGAYCAFRTSTTGTQIYSYHALYYDSSRQCIVNAGIGNVSIADIRNEVLNITLDYETFLLSVNQKAQATIKSSDAFAKNVPISLFSLHRKSYLNSLVQEDTYTSLAYFKFFSMKISSGGEVLNEWVPCINPDGLVGIYDIINDVFQSSGDATKPLVAGPVI